MPHRGGGTAATPELSAGVGEAQARRSPSVSAEGQLHTRQWADPMGGWGPRIFEHCGQFFVNDRTTACHIIYFAHCKPSIPVPGVDSSPCARGRRLQVAVAAQTAHESGRGPRARHITACTGGQKAGGGRSGRQGTIVGGGGGAVSCWLGAT